MIIVIDIYDSFTYNLVQILLKNNWPVEVHKNDQIELSDLKTRRHDIKAFLISPGPGNPAQSGICRSLIAEFHKDKPILGVCLGHQILAEFFGAKIIAAPTIMHGKISDIFHSSSGIYKNIPNPFSATRYHSLLVDKTTLPLELKVQSWSLNVDSGKEELMGFHHKDYPIEGLQFHPESIMTPQGENLVVQFFSKLA